MEILSNRWRIITALLLNVSLWLCPQTSLAEADGPDFWAVTGVNTGSALNLRRGPDTGFSVIDRIPWNAVKLENRGCVPNLTFGEYSALNKSERVLLGRISWCRVAYKNQQGWAAARYLRESNVH